MTLPIPTHNEAMVDASGRPTIHWRRYLAQIEAQGNTQLASDVEAIATALGSPDGTVANIPPQAELVAVLTARNGIRLFGTLASGNVRFELDQLADTGVGAALVKITRDAYGRVEGMQAAVLDDLSDVSAPSPTTGYALLWDGSAWVPGAMTVPQTTNRIDDSGNPRMGDDNALRKLD